MDFVVVDAEAVDYGFGAQAADFYEVLEGGLHVGVAEGVVGGGGCVPGEREGLGVVGVGGGFCFVVSLDDCIEVLVFGRPIWWSSPRPTSRKPTASMQAWVKSAIASYAFLSSRFGCLGRLLYIYSERFTALKTLPELTPMTPILLTENEVRDEDVEVENLVMKMQ